MTPDRAPAANAPQNSNYAIGGSGTIYTSKVQSKSTIDTFNKGTKKKGWLTHKKKPGGQTSDVLPSKRELAEFASKQGDGKGGGRAEHSLNEERSLKPNARVSSKFGTQRTRKAQEADIGIEFLIKSKKEESRLSQVWSKVMFVCHTYSFVNLIFWLAIHGFPEGFWLLLEICSEVILIVDVIMRLVIRHKFPELWRDMWLLHEKESYRNAKWYLVLLVLGSMPTTLILCLIYGRVGDMAELAAFEFSLFRCFKLLRHEEVLLYFDKLDYLNRKTTKPGSLSILKTFIVIYTFGVATHVIGCGWLVPPRFEPDTSKGWFAMDRFNIYTVDPLTKWMEA